MLVLCCPDSLDGLLLRCLYNLHESSVFSHFALLCARFLLFIALLTWLFSQGGADGRIVTNLFGMERLENSKIFSKV